MAVCDVIKDISMSESLIFCQHEIIVNGNGVDISELEGLSSPVIILSRCKLLPKSPLLPIIR